MRQRWLLRVASHPRHGGGHVARSGVLAEALAARGEDVLMMLDDGADVPFVRPAALADGHTGNAGTALPGLAAAPTHGPVGDAIRAHPQASPRRTETGPNLDAGAPGAANTTPFETAVADADILIYDFPATTTLDLGLCTDRPIVLIDHETMQFNESVRPVIEQRCRILRAVCDDRNRPFVDREELRDAVCGGPDRADPTPFRRLLLGAA